MAVKKSAAETKLAEIEGIKAGDAVMVKRTNELGTVTETVADVNGKPFFRVHLETGGDAGRVIALNPKQIQMVVGGETMTNPDVVVVPENSLPTSETATPDGDSVFEVTIQTVEEAEKKAAKEQEKAERKAKRAQEQADRKAARDQANAERKERLAKAAEEKKAAREAAAAAKTTTPKAHRVSKPKDLSMAPAVEGEGLCKCGCGEQVGKGASFRPGHDARLKGRLLRMMAWQEQHADELANGTLEPNAFEELAAIPQGALEVQARCSCCGQPMLVAHESGMGPICRAGKCKCAAKASAA